MDSQRFDQFARLIGVSRSRRSVIGLLAGGLAAGFLGPTRRDRAAAQTCGVLGDDCAENADCCTGLVCFEALCDNPSGLCMDEGEYCGSAGLECCEGLDCTDDYCVGTALPDTGIGSASDSGIGASLLGAGVAAGVTAALVGKRLRAQEVPVVADDRT
jgi:hypothetical protein